MYAQVIIDITHEKLDRVFTYCIPSELEGMLQIGMEVLVPFGASNKERHAYVLDFPIPVILIPRRLKRYREFWRSV